MLNQSIVFCISLLLYSSTSLASDNYKEACERFNPDMRFEGSSIHFETGANSHLSCKLKKEFVLTLKTGFIRSYYGQNNTVIQGNGTSNTAVIRDVNMSSTQV